MFDIKIEMMRKVCLYDGKVIYSKMSFVVRANNEQQAKRKALESLPSWFITNVVTKSKKRKPLK